MQLLFGKNEKGVDKTLWNDWVRGMGEDERGVGANAGRDPFICNREKVWLKLTLSLFKLVRCLFRESR